MIGSRLQDLDGGALKVRTTHRMVALALRGAVALIAASGTQAVLAQSAEGESGGSTLQDIVITATRHQEALSKVPESVTALSQETMDIKGVKDFTDVVKFTPGVTIDSNGTNSISIRGISASGGSGTTGIYIDDTPIQMRNLGFNADDTLPKTFDLERVEVLRGPQGTLFGAGSEGGTVRYIMAQPNMNEASANARTELSFTKSGRPSYEAGIAGGAPIIEGTLGWRASIWYRHDGGWIDKVDPITYATTESKANYTDTIAMRLAAKWAINDLWTVTPSVVYQNRNTHDATAYWPTLSSPGSSYVSADPGHQKEPDRYVLPAIKIETELFGASLISNTSYYSRREQSGYNGTEYNLSYFQTFWEQGLCADGTQTPYNAAVTPHQAPCATQPSWYPLISGTGIHLPYSATGWNPQTYNAQTTVTNQQNTIAQELRLQSSDPKAALVWTTGLFYSANRQTSQEQINDPMLPQFINYFFQQDYSGWFGYCAQPGNIDPTCNSFTSIALLANGDDYYNRNQTRDSQIAVFGEASYAVTDKLKATLGARYARSNVSYYHYSTGPQNFAINENSGTESDRPFTPKAGLSYQADPGNLYYFTYAKGFRIGGANPAIPFTPCQVDFQNINLPNGAPATYNGDTVDSFEVGAKNRIGDNFRIASSAYYIKWKDIQQKVYLPGCGLQFTMNMNSAVAKGADAQIEWNPVEALSMDAAFGITNAKYTQSVGSPGNYIAMAGDAVVGQSGTANPPWTLSVGMQYEFRALDRKSYVRLDATHEAMSHLLTALQDPATSAHDPYAFTPPATTVVSLRAGMQFEHWNVSAFAENLLNTHPDMPLDPDNYAHTDVDPYNANPPTPLQRRYTFLPRTIGVTASFKF